VNANLAKEVSKNKRANTIGASLTNAAITDIFRQTAGGSVLGFRADILVGVVGVTTAITAKHQHSNLPGLWTDAKTVSITASTDTAATANATTDQLTVTSHGLVENQPIVISASSLPGNILDKTIYFTRVIDANTIQLRATLDGAIVDIQSAGTSVKVTPVRAFSITYLPTVSGDQSHLPLRSSGQLVVTTGTGDSVDVLGVKINQED
jgi:hypothetical protein